MRPVGAAFSLSGLFFKVYQKGGGRVSRNYALTIRRSMRKMGTYRREYEQSVSILAQMMEQYAELTERFEASGLQYEVSTGAGSKKAPIVTTLESLRKDILAYLSALGLTPAGARKIEAARAEGGGPVSALEKALREMGGG